MVLQEKELVQENVFALGRDGAVLGHEDPGTMLQDVSLFDLISAFNDILKKAKPEEIGEILAERFTVADKIDAVLCMVGRGQSVRFTSLFGETATRHEIVCTFLALLELIRLRQVSVFQQEHFGDIMISRIEDSDEIASVVDDLEDVNDGVESKQPPVNGESVEMQKEEENGEH